MATKKINYKDKAPLQTKPEIPEENKVNAEDLNQIKEVVNNNADEIELRQLKEEGKGLSKNDFTDELKAKLESLNNYSDTEIKKEISEINKKVAENTENDIKQDNEILELKTNYTNLQEQNTKLEEQVKKDRENMINLETEGQSIHIEDSSDLEGKLEVLGNVEQDVREGYNLLNNSLTNRTVNGLTVIVNKDKSVTIKGTPTANATIKIDDTKNKNLPAGTYTLKDCQAYVESEENNGWWNGTEMAATLTFNNTPTLGNHGFYLYFSSGIAVNRTYYPQLVAGAEEKPYEPYGASPSPEYPSEIRAVGDNINLLENKAKTQTVNGVTFTANEDGSIIANGTAEAEASLTINNQINLEKGEYCASGCPKGGGNNTYRIGLWNNTWESIALDLGDSSIFTLQQNTETIKCAINIKQGTTVNNVVFKPKIKKGTIATSYSKFGQGSVGIKKTTANYYNVRNYAGSQQPPVDKEDWITLKGSNTGENDTYLNYFTKNLDLVVGKKYWIIAEIKSVSGNGNFNITSQAHNGGQFKGHYIEISNLSAGKSVIFQEIAAETSIEQGLRTFISIPGGQSANITFRISVLETEPNKSNWKYVPYKKETKILPIQKPMLEGDYFVKEVDGWEEAHTWKKIILTGQENTWQLYTSGVRRFGLDLTKDLPKKETGKYATGYCTHFKVATTMNIDLTMFLQLETDHFYIGIVDKNSKWTDVNALKSELQRLYNAGTPIILYYKVEIPTKLPCTPEQTEILDELDNFQTYKPVTNITTDSIAKLKLKYIADTKTYVDNKTSNLEQQVNTINQLLSTTKTSSVLLDNLQTDIEREVL